MEALSTIPIFADIPDWPKKPGVSVAHGIGVVADNGLAGGYLIECGARRRHQHRELFGNQNVSGFAMLATFDLIADGVMERIIESHANDNAPIRLAG